MTPPSEIRVVELFPPLLQELLAVLASLGDEDWARPTACAGWSVKDVAAHLLAGDLGKLSRGRDGWASGIAPRSAGELATLINTHNERWVQLARFVSPRVLQDLLAVTGPQVSAYVASLDPTALGEPVSWAGWEPAPVWLDLAREYTERWHHQQHIREAVGRPGVTEPRFLAPVLATFVHALPVTYRDVGATAGTLVGLTIAGPAGGRWTLRRQPATWTLEAGGQTRGAAEVTLDEDTAWRLFTKGLTRERAAAAATISGDRRLGETLLDAVAIIA